MWEWGIEPPTHMRDGTQPRSQLVKKQESAQRVEGCKNGAGLFTVPKKYKKMTQKNTASRQAVAYQMPDLFPLPCLPIK